MRASASAASGPTEYVVRVTDGGTSGVHPGGEGEMNQPSVIEITDEMVERLATFLQDEWAGPYIARIREYMPDEFEPGPERDRAIVALQTADRKAEAQARRVARKALRVALACKPTA